MRDEIAFSVPGVAATKGSARAFYSPRHRRVMVWADNREQLKAWEEIVRFYAIQARGVGVALWRDVAVHLELVFVFVRPKGSAARRRRGHYVKPDLSKLIRGFEDALTGVLYVDDAQVSHVIAEKRYAGAGEASRVDARLWVERSTGV